MTGDRLIYKYLDINTPSEKINYSYSKYGGEPFLSSYLKSRDDVIAGEYIDNAIFLDINSSIATELLFNEWISNLQEKREINIKELDLLLKRFEVTKKLFENYDSNFRPIEKSKFLNFRLYVLFSYILSLSYKEYKKLQYLNALLKVNDINISNIENLDKVTKDLLRLSIKYEITFIGELSDKIKQ